MIGPRILLQTIQLDEIGGEPLDGSGFEDETPDAVIDASNEISETGEEG